MVWGRQSRASIYIRGPTVEVSSILAAFQIQVLSLGPVEACAWRVLRQRRGEETRRGYVHGAAMAASLSNRPEKRRGAHIDDCQSWLLVAGRKRSTGEKAPM